MNTKLQVSMYMLILRIITRTIPEFHIEIPTEIS